MLYRLNKRILKILPLLNRENWRCRSKKIDIYIRKIRNQKLLLNNSNKFQKIVFFEFIFEQIKSSLLLLSQTTKFSK